MDYTRWAEIQHQHHHHLSHHPASSANESHSSQYYNAQPYNPYSYQTNPADTVTTPQKHPPTGYNNPPIHYDLGHSDVGLRPPGMDPYGTAGAAGHNSYAPHSGHEQMSSVAAVGYFQETHPQDWTVKESIRHYGADPVLYGTAGRPQNGMEHNQISNPNIMAWNKRMYPDFFSAPWKRGPKKTKVLQSVHCEVCNLDCNSKDVYDMHRAGKKHKRNVEQIRGGTENQIKPKVNIVGGKKVGQAGAMPISSVKRKKAGGSVVPDNLEMKRAKLREGGAALEAVKVCVICNLACNSQTVYDYHLAGKKHAAQLRKQMGVVTGVATGVGVGASRVISNPVIGNNRTFYPASTNGMPKKGLKKTQVAQPERCLICDIVCNNKEMMEKHKVGKKHMRNLQKLEEPTQNQKNEAQNQQKEATPAGVGGLSSASSAQVKSKNNPAEKGSMENGSGKGPGGQEGANKTAVAPEVAVEDLDTKKRKLMEGGAREADLKVCALCNLVCNSQKVFDIHIGGKKHAAQVKKQTELPGADAPLEFSSA